MKIIAVSGQMQNGKDLVANYLANNLASKVYKDGAKSYSWRRTAWARTVKDIFCNTFGEDIDFVEKWKVNPEPPPGYSQNIRQALQFIGDGFRKIRGNIWVEAAFRPIEMQLPTIISDSRYINELQKVRDVDGINILVYRPGFINDDPNGSEAQIRPLVEWFVEQGCEGILNHQQLESTGSCKLIDIFIRNDGTIEDLYTKLSSIVIPFIESFYEDIA